MEMSSSGSQHLLSTCCLPAVKLPSHRKNEMYVIQGLGTKSFTTVAAGNRTGGPVSFLLCLLWSLDCGGQVAKAAGTMGQCCWSKMREGSVVLDNQNDPTAALLLAGKPTIPRYLDNVRTHK